MLTEIIHYQHDGVNFKGFLAKPNNAHDKTPAIIVSHAWRGQDDFARQKAEELAEMGYVGFALDLYGNGANATTDEEATQLMLPLFLDRALLRQRMTAGLETLKNYSFVDEDSIGAIGFCFGGLAVIELLRSGANVKGVVSFHGLFGNTINDYKAETQPDSKNITGSLLILHGYKDPLSSQLDISTFQDEMTEANIDWQMNIYGEALHAFTNPQAHNREGGMIYNPRIAHRAWLAMTNFFNELFINPTGEINETNRMDRP